jgi:hypothetical protein
MGDSIQGNQTFAGSSLVPAALPKASSWLQGVVEVRRLFTPVDISRVVFCSPFPITQVEVDKHDRVYRPFTLPPREPSLAENVMSDPELKRKEKYHGKEIESFKKYSEAQDSQGDQASPTGSTLDHRSPKTR